MGTSICFHKDEELSFIALRLTMLWHVNPLLGNARNTHTVQQATMGQRGMQPASTQRIGKQIPTHAQWRRTQQCLAIT
jgi:hypothetical protein